MKLASHLTPLALCLYLFGAAGGQDPAGDTPPAGETSPPAAAVDPAAIKLHLMDGSTIFGKLAIQELEVETAFGNLKVPLAALKSFTPGLASHPEVAQDISDLVEDLGSGNFSKREAAQKQLLEMGVAVRGQLEARAEDPDAERRTRIKELLEEFEQAEDDLAEADDSGWGHQSLIDKDTIDTLEFTVIGKIVPQSFTIESQYGPLTIELADIRRGERSIAPSEFRKTVRVQGLNLAQINMLSTGIRLARGDTVSVAADGSIVMSPWGNEMSSSPDGGANFGWFIPNQIASGTLVGKIGGNGEIFKLGSKASFTADRAGVLYLGMAMQGDYANGNYQFPGEYRVRLRVQRK